MLLTENGVLAGVAREAFRVRRADGAHHALIEALRIITEDLGIIGLSYTSENIPVRKGLIGPGPRWPGQVGNTWNVHEWRWQG